MRYQLLEEYLLGLVERLPEPQLFAAFGLLAAARMWANYEVFCVKNDFGNPASVKADIQRLWKNASSVDQENSGFVEISDYGDPKLLPDTDATYLPIGGLNASIVQMIGDQICYINSFLQSGDEDLRHRITMIPVENICEYLAELNGRDQEDQGGESLLGQELKIVVENIEELIKRKTSLNLEWGLLEKNFNYGSYLERIESLNAQELIIAEKRDQPNLFGK